MANNFFNKLSSSYRFIALTLVNTLLALLVLNGIFSVIFSVKDHFRSDPVSAKYGSSNVKAVYPGLKESEINALLKETWSRPYIYAPFTQFKERPYQGSHINVDNNGFRVTKNQGSWPPQGDKLNIFMFGGSTTFGYGVDDNQTLASFLQESLAKKLKREVRVYNFGQGHYYSTQERIQYENILASGVIPDLAIFVDGLNDFYYNSNEPLFTDRLSEFVEPKMVGNKGMSFIAKTSIGRVVRGLNYQLTKLLQGNKHGDLESINQEVNLEGSGNYTDPKVLNAVINRYLQNKKLIEAASLSFEINPIFIWQPIPTYHYDQSYHLFSKGDYENHSYAEHGYKLMAETIKENPLSDNFLWLADIQKNKKEPLYVDKLHYSASFSKEMAMKITELIINRSLINKTNKIER